MWKKTPIGGYFSRPWPKIWINMEKKIGNGVYVVVDPARDPAQVIRHLAPLRGETLAAVQIWDNPDVELVSSSLIEGLVELFSETATPVLINNHWEILADYGLDGVHFDALPEDWERMRERIARPFIKGLTLQNDLSPLAEFARLNVDYLSFCALFPSATAGQCEIVRMETVEKCRQLTTKPIFLSGGIDVETIPAIRHLPANGVAVVSAIMDAEDPAERVRLLTNLLTN